MKAEIVRCLDIIDSNVSFHAAESDNDKYATIFPDSDVVKHYHQKSNKVKYTLQFGVAPSISEIILNELKDQPFTFSFDETTTSQIKKQYAGYATYFSRYFNTIITSYLGTLYVGKCTAEDLLQNLNILMQKLGLHIGMIICLGMDGPSVNNAFARKLNELLEVNVLYMLARAHCIQYQMHF